MDLADNRPAQTDIGVVATVQAHIAKEGAGIGQIVGRRAAEEGRAG